MPCQCTGNQNIPSAPGCTPCAPAITETPQGVCETNPCSTRDNINAIAACQRPAQGTDCAPIYLEPTAEEILSQRRSCTDPNGCTAFFREECRDGFWPDFAHPRWLCCKELYNAH